MGFNCGIVGLPNVGKSTLFNAITNTAAAAAANYPFCTIEPNVGRVPVPDPRLEQVARGRRLGQSPADPARDHRHRRAGARRQSGRGAGQPLSRRDPRGRRDPPRAALLRGRRRRPCRGQRRSVARCRAGRDRAAARRPRRAGAARRRPDQAGARRRCGGQGPARADRADPAGDGGGTAGAPARAVAGRAARACRTAAAPDREAVLYVCNVDEAAAARATPSARGRRARRKGAGAVVVAAAIEAELAGLAPDDRREYLPPSGSSSRASTG